MLETAHKQKTALKKPDNPFPVKLSVFSLVLTLCVVLWANGNSFFIERKITVDIQNDIRINNLGDQFAYLDSVITRTLKLSVATGDPKWIRAYRENTRLSDETINTLKTATIGKVLNSPEGDIDIHKMAEGIDRNTDFFLTALEEKVLDLVGAGKMDEARALLDGQEYTQRKQDYSDEVHRLALFTNKILSQTLFSLARTASYTLYLGVIAVLTLPVAWFFSYRSIRRWRQELEKARQTLLVNEKQLQQFIGEIEISQTQAIKARQAAEREARTIALLRSVSVTANKVTDIGDAIQTVLTLMCEYMNCSVGHAYVRDPHQNLLRSTRIWFVKDREAFKGFVAISETTTFARGVGLPGHVWDTTTPLWISDLAQDMTFQCAPRVNLGVKSGLAFPLTVDSEVQYVLEFFFSDVTPANAEFLTIMQEVGNQLVRVIERAEAEQRLKRAKDVAEKASAAKSEFLANMSHELRTPLNSILGMLRLLKDGKLAEEKQELQEERSLVETAFRSSTNLLEIVNDILDLSKIEAGEMRLECIGMDLTYAIDSVVLTLDHLAREKRVALVWNRGREDFPYVLGDPTRFAHVLTNMIGNAIKYTEEGSVEVRASCTNLDNNQIEFRCSITDTGIGISPEKLQSVFEKFVQADTSTTRKYGGTGLGLAITKQLVELMGGTIGVESQLGVGSTFWFTLPFETTDQVSKEKKNRKKNRLTGTRTPEAARILVAEDHPMNQILITKLMQRFGIGTFEIASNGAIALKRYTEAPWDIILMDCHMPEKNGYDTTIDIRKFEQTTGKHVPIIAMTANAMIGDREKCLRCGMDEYVSKPIAIDELKDVLGQWIRFGEPLDGKKNESIKSDEAIPLDLSQLRAISENDTALERVLITAFIEQSDMNWKSLVEEHVKAAIDAWKKTAHMFKGGALGIGAATLADFCNKAQHFNGTPEEQKALMADIDREYGRVKDYLKTIGFLI